jgi:hypothetical protein
MRNAGLIAFSVTTCVLVPAAIHQLSAGKEQIAKLGAPSEDSFELKGAKIKASLDRFMLDPGDPLTVKLEATEVKGKKLEVGVLVLGSNGTEGDRVQTPPNGIAFRIVKLEAKDGVATAQTTIALEGATTRTWRPFGHYEVLVGEPNAIEKLEHLRRGSGLIEDSEDEIPELNHAGSKFMGLYRGWSIEEGDKTSPYVAGKLARLEAHTRPLSNAIVLTVPDTTSVDHAFMVSVTVANPGRRTMKNLEVNLTEQLGYDIDVEPPPAKISRIEPEKIAIDLGPHETKTVQFRVTPGVAGVVGLYAQAACVTDYDDEHSKACKDVQAFQLGAFDATEIKPVDEKAPSVAVH